MGARNAHRILVGKTPGKLDMRRKENIRTDHREISFDDGR
jgi:hypothetical protein